MEESLTSLCSHALEPEVIRDVSTSLDMTGGAEGAEYWNATALRLNDGVGGACPPEQLRRRVRRSTFRFDG